MADPLVPSSPSHPSGDARWPGEFRPYQGEALDEVDARWADGHRRTWVVLPPGAGKTLVGLEAARRLGRRTVVFAPNTAIQGQWVSHWHAFERPDGCDAGTGRDLGHQVTVLTYQSLAVFDPDTETDEEGRETTPATMKERLHANGAALVDALHSAGPLTVLLDECHHLLQAWGRLLDEVLAELDDAYVIGLTGTPAASLTASEHDLVDRLFGPPITGASIPALVRSGYLAPFAELAYVTEPTAVERDYLAEQGSRFSEMCTDLLAPGFADTDFLPWLHVRFTERATGDGDSGGGDGTVGRLPWPRLAALEPELTDAVLRLHYVGLCELPDGARLLERHRHPPHAEDWTVLIGDYARRCLDAGSERDRAAYERIRAALPSVGYHLTKRGIRRGASPVDRVLARSAAKSYATVEIVAAEAGTIGSRMRALVLCDHEHAAARAPARLRGVLADDAGSAWLQLELLAADDRTDGFDPMLVTGRAVAAGPHTAAAFIAYAEAERPVLELKARLDGKLCRIEGSWNARDRVELVTRFFEEGHCQVLVGTRALLGEGWDARGVNTVVDVTTATTPTAVVQSRGRALRLDPSWPDKTAHTWTVVCVTHNHPRGAADWDRFVRKHEGYLGADAEGEVMSGVAHVDPAFSPFEPPDSNELDAVNARMLVRAGRREETRRRWRVGSAYSDLLLPTLRVRPDRPTTPPGGEARGDGAAIGAAVGASMDEGAVSTAAAVCPDGGPGRSAALTVVGTAADGGPPEAVPAAAGAVERPALPDAGRTRKGHLLSSPLPSSPVAGTLMAMGALSWAGSVAVAASGVPGIVVLAALGVLLVAAGAAAEGRRRRSDRIRAAEWLLAIAARPVDTARYACAVADGLHTVGRSSAGAEGVRVTVDADGVYRYTLTGAGPQAAEDFATALDEVLAPPVGSPRYILSRYVIDEPADDRDARGRACALVGGEPHANHAVYHVVPTVFARRRADAKAFAEAWSTWVSEGELTYAPSARGQEILAAQYGTDPTGVTTARRLSWT